MPKIFISYKRQDKKKVFPIVDEIKKQTGIDCWIDLNGIESGDQFQNVIINAIDNADIVICMLSKNFIAPYKDEKTGEIDYTKQTFPEKEVMYALNQGKRLIPISIDGTRVSDCKWLQFNCSGLDCIDIRDNDQKNKLFRNISQWFGHHEDINPPKPQPDFDKYKFVLLSLALIGCIIAIVILLIQNKKSSETSQHIIIPDTVVISQEVTDSASKQQTVLSSDTKVTNVATTSSTAATQKKEEPKMTASSNSSTTTPSSFSTQTTEVKHQTEVTKDNSTTEKTDLIFIVKGVSFTMVKVAGGTFTMGATAEQGDDAYDKERPTHQVTLSDYYMGQTEVTQALWKAVMGENPSIRWGDNLPVESVSWEDCQTFIRRLNEKLSSQLGGKLFSLPTEAQWEFAARGGNKSLGYKYAGSNNLGEVAWYDDNSSMPHPVSQKQPNELGLYDISGNVWEWCKDWYGSYSSSAQTNPQGPADGTGRVIRGGSWNNSTEDCRVSIRDGGSPAYRLGNLGLRLCLLP